MENEEKLRPFLVPVFDHLYNLYDHELEFYITYWEEEKNKQGPNENECDEKLKALYEEKNRRNQKEKDND